MGQTEYKRRLEFINEDVKILYGSLTDEVINTPVPNYESVGVLLSNIEIASNLNDDESLGWKTKFNIPTHDPQTGDINPYYEELTGSKNPLVVSNIDKMPNQKWHQIISFIKSGVRIVGYCFIPFNLVLATVLLVLSEVIGIVEELV
jgi:hypothetical protein